MWDRKSLVSFSKTNSSSHDLICLPQIFKNYLNSSKLYGKGTKNNRIPTLFIDKLKTRWTSPWLSSKDPPACQCRRHRFDPWLGKIPWRRKWQPTPAFLPGKSTDRGACQSTVHGLAESNATKRWSTCSHFISVRYLQGWDSLREVSIF